MNKLKKRIILVGAGGAGKDFFRDYLIKEGLSVDISYTTRPMREGEKDGETYIYITDKKFEEMKAHKMFYEDIEFNGWKYATTVNSWNKKRACIKTPSGIKQLTDEDREKSIIVYFDIPRNFRAERMEKRKDADHIGRRLAADAADFRGFCGYDIRVTNERFNCKELLKVIQHLDKV